MQIPDNVTPLDQARPEGDRAWNEKKKERTRAQLLEAAVRLISERGVDAATVNDIVTEAAVAPGTFYNYFPALDAMLAELATGLCETIATHSAQRTKARDPASRLAYIMRAHLARARSDASWAKLVIHFAALPALGVRAALVKGLEDDIIDGIGKGQFSAEADEAAPDLVVGALLAGFGRLAEGHVGPEYDRNLTANILRGLGMVSAAALERVQRGI
ncbi:MAG: TetR/AcrR family transcriptional regulator [Pseudomonadota bacterium]